MKLKQRMLTTLLCLMPLLLSCSTHYQGEKAEPVSDPEQEYAVSETDFSISITIPEQTDPGLFLYENPSTRVEVLDFYNNITGDVEITRAIIQNAIQYEIPLTLAFSLAYGESDFNRWAVNKNVSSIDRGLFQLNSKTFPNLTEQEFFDPAINAQYALRYFRWCLDQGGNEIVGIAMYNAGRGRVEYGGTPRITLDHIDNILDYKSELDRHLLEWVNNNPALEVTVNHPVTIAFSSP